MKETLHIDASFDKPDLLKDMVEQLAGKRYRKHLHSHERSMLETASTEAYVCGTISLEEEGEIIRLPFDSSFLFTCIRNYRNKYEIAWSVSLS